VNQEQRMAERRSLGEVREQFEIWRNQRKRGGRIPQLLWQAARGVKKLIRGRKEESIGILTGFDRFLDQLSHRRRDVVLPPKMHPCILGGPLPASVKLCQKGKPGTRCPGRLYKRREKKKLSVCGLFYRFSGDRPSHLGPFIEETPPKYTR
jgi:hypothetical protein